MTSYRLGETLRPFSFRITNMDVSVHQDGQNGPLVASVRKRIQTVREKLGLSWAGIGDAFGFSNTFVHGIAREKDPQRIRSKHVAKLIQNLESLEVKAGILKASKHASTPSHIMSAADLSLEDLINAIHAKGFTVHIGPATKA